MKLLTCKLCRKLFSSNGTEICQNCMEKLDSCFKVVREYLHENPKQMFDEKEMSEELNIDVRYIQALVRMGYLDQLGISREDETAKKLDLARQLQASLSKSTGTHEVQHTEKADTKSSSLNAMYAQDKHGNRRRER